MNDEIIKKLIEKHNELNVKAWRATDANHYNFFSGKADGIAIALIEFGVSCEYDINGKIISFNNPAKA